MIDRHKYPELNLILWDTASRFIEPKFAFKMYEKRWNYIHKDKLTPTEKELIQKLTQDHGNGLFLI